MDTFVSRRAAVLGATGLVGRALLDRLLADPRYGDVHVLARRDAPAGLKHRKLRWHVVPALDDAGVPWPAVDDVYCALGTTRRDAGSDAAFRHVDHTLVVHAARMLRRRGAERLAVVSSLGADARSGLLYPQVKGRMEADVRQLGYATLVIARPSLLTGPRDATGQPQRSGERWALRLLEPLGPLVPGRWRPIAAADVAAGLHEALLGATPGVHVLDGGALRDEAATALQR